MDRAILPGCHSPLVVLKTGLGWGSKGKYVPLGTSCNLNPSTGLLGLSPRVPGLYLDTRLSETVFAVSGEEQPQ